LPSSSNSTTTDYVLESDHLLQDHIEELMKNGMDPNSSSMQDLNVSKDIQSRIDGGDNQEQLMKSRPIYSAVSERRWS
jgi:uncharacterized protein with gpF-like domain